jgi:deoxyribodipyrimidine photo-lyase
MASRILQSRQFQPGRAAGLERLAAFLPQAGRAYAATRNNDLGADDRSNVSTLSPYLRTRLVTEEEVLRAVLGRFAWSTAEKFVQEVFWRAYFKGHLETRPQIWSRYRTALAGQMAALEAGGGFAKAYTRAVEGRTGIDAFDHWAHELVETGYLHNHARMWFASIWIFTLKLPWELGADFTLRHFIDGDPASNTLSWRWVGGLHTRGKTYLARPDNIETYTHGRFRPTGLAREAVALEEPEIGPAQALPRAMTAPSGRALLLLTEDDLHPESLPLHGVEIVAVAGTHALRRRSDLLAGDKAGIFMEASLRDALDRASAHFAVPVLPLTALDAVSIGEAARASGVRTVVAPHAPVGPTAEALADIAPALRADTIDLVMVRRAYDSATWPHATRGFFALKEKIPRLIDELRIVAEPAQTDLFA